MLKIIFLDLNKISSNLIFMQLRSPKNISLIKIVTESLKKEKKNVLLKGSKKKKKKNY